MILLPAAGSAKAPEGEAEGRRSGRGERESESGVRQVRAGCLLVMWRVSAPNGHPRPQGLDLGPMGSACGSSRSIAITAEQRSRRSSIAAATIGSSKIWPHAAMPPLVVTMIEPFW